MKDETDLGNGSFICGLNPQKNYLFRIELGKNSIVGFPKFGTIGIGFETEVDRNTNFPYTCTTEEIYEHIKHNRCGCRASKKRVLAAIKEVQSLAAIEHLVAERNRYRTALEKLAQCQVRPKCENCELIIKQVLGVTND